jgi:hypothetical protein
MTTSSEHVDPSAQPEPAGTSLLPDQARATVEEIKAENAALEEADQLAEAQAEAMAEQAKQLAEVTEEVLEELKESREAASPG